MTYIETTLDGIAIDNMINVFIHHGQKNLIFRAYNQKKPKRRPEYSTDFSVFCFRWERGDLVQGWSGELCLVDTLGNTDL